MPYPMVQGIIECRFVDCVDLYTVRKLYLNFDVCNSFVLELNAQCDLLKIGL